MVDYSIGVTPSVFDGLLESKTLLFERSPSGNIEEDQVILFKDFEDTSKLIGRKHIVGISSANVNESENTLEISIYDIVIHGRNTKLALEKSRNPLYKGEMGYVLTILRDHTEDDEYDLLCDLVKDFNQLSSEELSVRLKEIQSKTDEAYTYLLVDNLLDVIHADKYMLEEETSNNY
ncbi:hypothetical protein ACQUY5_20130 [Bacillus cereus]|uniref:hypothetical protein n=1 Tax=Bacillus cereus TaxID=1396 RepID=UPI003D187310